jgi:hypothetical protein
MGAGILENVGWASASRLRNVLHSINPFARPSGGPLKSQPPYQGTCSLAALIATDG